MEDFSEDRPPVFSQKVKAGRRTYFLDVRSTKASDYYITITESKKSTHNDGNVSYEKHKIYLYKEDFLRFQQAMEAVMGKVEELLPDYDFDTQNRIEKGNSV